MSSSYAYSESTTFTVTHAKYLASKIATDLKRIQRFYGAPSDEKIASFEQEAIELLKKGYLEKVTYGFQKDDNWIEPTVVYTVDDLNISNNDDPGKIRPGKDIQGASFGSFLEYTSEWFQLSEDEQAAFKSSLLIKRTFGDTPGINGYLEDDKMYSSGGRALSRASVRSY